MSHKECFSEARFWFLEPLPDFINVWIFKSNRVSGIGRYHSIQPNPSGVTLRIFKSGSWKIVMSGKNYTAAPGDIFYALPSEKIEFWHDEADTGWEWLEIQFCGPAAAGFVEQFGLNRKNAVVRPLQMDLTLNLFEEIHKLMAKDFRKVSEILQLMFMLVGAVGREPGSDSEARRDGTKNLVAGVIDVIESMQFLDCNVSQLSELFNIDRTTLCRAFKKETGITPHEFIDRQRFNRAAELLMSTAMAVKKIARRAGFPDVKYFTSWFKDKTGYPPGKWRKLPH